MSKTKLITTVVVLLTVVGLIAWDVVVYLTPEVGDTISEVTLAWAWKSAFIPFALGVLGGHLTWPRKASATYRKWSAIGLLIFGVALGIADLVGITPNILPVWYFLPGVLAGHFFWGQTQLSASKDGETEGD